MNLDYNKNEDIMKMALSQMRTRLDKIALGGGKKAIEKQREKNKLTPRERIAYLVDENTSFIEIGAFARLDDQHGALDPFAFAALDVADKWFG